MAAKLLRLRYKATCGTCGSELSAGSQGWWDSDLRQAACVDCHQPEADSGTPDLSLPLLAFPPPPPASEVSPAAPPPPAPPGPPAADVAGASARQMYERKHLRREEKIEQKWGRLSGVVKFLADDPQSTKAWAKGSEGERRLAAHLVRSVGDRAILLHDRRIPGSQANIDHLAVAASGVWIIDAKSYKGKVEQRDVGGWFKVDRRLYVNGRNRSKLVNGFARQIDAVLEAIGDAEAPVNPALCFTDSDWGLFGKPFRQGGVWVTWAKDLCEKIAAPGSLDPDDVASLGERLATHLPPAVST